jgi:hypothetical protein
MFRRIFSIILPPLILFLSSGCQEDSGSSIPIASNTPLPATPTATSTLPIEQFAIPVPQGKPPLIDGTISPGEWDNAMIESFSDGSELLLMYSEGYLYLGIRANASDMIVGNVFINHGDEIVILHASAALGAAIYQKETDQWQLTQNFDWCCRGTGDNEAAQEERWVGTNSRIGTPNELEFQIEMTNESLRMAANYIKVSEPNVKIPWPNDLDDDCIKPTPGGLPELLYFLPDKWATIGIQSSETSN